jgi:hypothetical protein
MTTDELSFCLLGGKSNQNNKAPQKVLGNFISIYQMAFMRVMAEDYLQAI